MKWPSRIFYPTMPWIYFDLRMIVGKRKCKISDSQALKLPDCWAVSCLFTSLIWNLTYFTSYTYEWVIPNVTKNQYELCYCLSLTCYWGFPAKWTPNWRNSLYSFRAFCLFLIIFLFLWIKINYIKIEKNQFDPLPFNSKHKKLFQS